MKLKHLLEAVSSIEWKNMEWQDSGPLFHNQQFYKQLQIRSKAEWILLVIKKAKELGDGK
jgi:hypothetical protein